MIGAELQKAIYDALKAAPEIAGGRVYDNPPTNAVFSYITIGDEQVLDDGNACSDGWEVFADVHAWSRPENGSKAEVKGLVAAVVARLRAIDTVAGFSVVVVSFESARTFRDTDGITEHSVITMRFVLDPA